jgi:predicted metal-dependent HD superfamily phosphohydrolase
MDENEYLNTEWLNLASTFTQDKSLIDHFYNQIITEYSAPARHYHNIQHVQNMLICIKELKGFAIDYPVLLLSAWYHDVVYVPLKTNNEEESYSFAKKQLLQLHFSREKIHAIKNLILSTKNHCIRQKSDSIDIKILQDSDLQVFSFSRDDYKNYMQQIREEYKMIPEFIFRPKRKKIVNNFLAMHHIYRTPSYRDANEAKARDNLNYELDCLI